MFRAVADCSIYCGLLDAAGMIPCSSVRLGRMGRWIACMLLLVPRASFADFAAVCQPNSLNGAVKRMVVMAANADIESRAATRPLQVRNVADVTPDGRTVIQVSTYLEDPSPEVRATSFTIIRQYDSGRRMASEIIKNDGQNISTRTTCEYDDLGRLARAIVLSDNPMLTRTLTYRYGPSWRSEQLVTEAVSILTTITIDEKGRPLVEKQHDELKHVQLGSTEYRYLAEGVEECIRQFDGSRPCRVSIRDAHGNEVEARSETATTRIRYRYDNNGNWTERITSTTGLPTSGVWRRITYW